MKSQFFRVATLPALVLSSGMLAFGGSQTRLYPNSKDPVQDRSGITQAVNQGKGTMTTLNQPAQNANAYRAQTTQDKAAVRDESGAVRSNIGDVAYRK
jgi:hypothetical protein